MEKTKEQIMELIKGHNMAIRSAQNQFNVTESYEFSADDLKKVVNSHEGFIKELEKDLEKWKII